MLYVLAAIELTNTRFKSSQVKSVADILKSDLPRNVEELLRTPLSEISDALLCKEWSSAAYFEPISGVSQPSNLNIPMLQSIGSLKVDWTEYMQEHLKFDPVTMTVYVYWYFTHILNNASWQ